MRVLIVGAGAVGQVYARHLQRGGAHITFFVKPKYEESVRQGLVLHPLNGKRGVVRMSGYDVVTSVADVRGLDYDQVWLCVASNALQGAWLDELGAALPKATFVSLQPGLEERRALEQRLGAERLVHGLITFIAWQAPLPGESLSPPGIMYWLPPLSATPFSGARERVQPIVETLRRGGCPAKRVDDVAVMAAAGESLLQPLVAALEASDWSFAKLSRGPMLAVGVTGIRQTFAIASAYLGRKLPPLVHLARPSLVRLVIWLAPKVLPFDIERYMAYHFSKVGAQTRMLLASYIEQARAKQLPHDALDTLHARLLALPRGHDEHPQPRCRVMT